MAYKIIIYCPDQHILYNPTTPDRKGVGGGLMARIRLAQALTRLGHSVTIISHVSNVAKHKGVEYLPLSAMSTLQKTVDVLILISSGGALSLESAEDLNIQSRLREIWLQGNIPIKGVDRLSYDYIVGPSNFICTAVEKDWGIAFNKFFCIYNGAATLSEKWWSSRPARDPYSLIYTSHPSKGLNAAVEVLNLLREKDKRFCLHVYGGDALWGGDDKTVSAPGVVYHGTQGQQTVFQGLLRASFALNLQERLEPFGMVVTEAMKHGCIPVASPVGAYSEIIKNGYNGFLIHGNYMSPDVHRQAADTITQLVRTPYYTEYIRRQATQMPWTWDSQARVWEQHWDWALEKKGETIQTGTSHCPKCEGAWLLTADGYHCTTCGSYSQAGE